MEKSDKKVYGIVARYLLIILLGLGNLYFFYKVLTPLTIYSVYAVLNLFSSNVFVLENWIYFNNITISIIPACVAGAAFYLLFILNFSTGDLDIKKRIYVLLSSFLILFLFNIIRIVFLVFMFGSSFFEVMHFVFWNFLSTLAVVGIWFLMVKLYSIKNIPIYSDFIYLKNIAFGKRLKKKSKNSKRSKKN